MVINADSIILDDYKSSDRVTVAKFGAAWCGPCKALKPVIDEMAKEVDATFLDIDVDQNEDLASKYGIRGVPTLLFFKNGEILKTMVGNNPKHEILAAIKTVQDT